MSDIEDLKLRVKKGMEFLDNIAWGWEGLINLDSFNIREQELCILGQIYGDYWDAVETLDLSKYDAEDLGFYVTGSGSWEEYKQLQNEWKEALTERKSNA